MNKKVTWIRACSLDSTTGALQEFWRNDRGDIVPNWSDNCGDQKHRLSAAHRYEGHEHHIKSQIKLDLVDARVWLCPCALNKALEKVISKFRSSQNVSRYDVQLSGDTFSSFEAFLDAYHEETSDNVEADRRLDLCLTLRSFARLSTPIVTPRWHRLAELVLDTCNLDRWRWPNAEFLRSIRVSNCTLLHGDGPPRECFANLQSLSLNNNKTPPIVWIPHSAPQLRSLTVEHCASSDIDERFWMSVRVFHASLHDLHVKMPTANDRMRLTFIVTLMSTVFGKQLRRVSLAWPCIAFDNLWARSSLLFNVACTKEGDCVQLTPKQTATTEPPTKRSK